MWLAVCRDSSVRMFGGVRLMTILISQLAQALSSQLTSQDGSCAVLERNPLQKILCKIFPIEIHAVFCVGQCDFIFIFFWSRLAIEAKITRMWFYSCTLDLL